MTIPQSLPDIVHMAWTADRLADGIESLARISGFLSRSTRSIDNIPPPNATDSDIFDRWFRSIATHIGVEAEPVVSSYGDLARFLRDSCPAVLRLPMNEAIPDPHFLLVLRGSTNHLIILTPQMTQKTIALATVQHILSSPLEEPYSERVEHMLTHIQASEKQQQRVRASLLNRWLSSRRIEAGWMIRLAPAASLWKHIRHLRLPRYAFALIVVMVVRHLLEILAWWMVGQAVFTTQFDHSWFVVLALLLFTTVPFHLMEYGIFNRGNALAGLLLRQRLMEGTLRLEPEEVRHQGAGQFLGLVMEVEMVEQLALAGGFYIVSAPVKMAMALGILLLGAGGAAHAVILAGWFGIALLMAWVAYRRTHDWIASHRDMSNDLAEKMVGHRTRLAQQPESQWHTEEDRAWTRYFHLAQRLDRIALHIYSTLPNVWMLLGLATLLPAFIWQNVSPSMIAVSLGGVLLAYEALLLMNVGFQNGVQAVVGWKQVAPLVHAATRTAKQPSLDVGVIADNGKQPESQAGAVLQAEDVSFAYASRASTILHGCSLTIHAGERLLLEGPSGGGKSTLAALLSGLRVPQSGLVLLRNYDRNTLGDSEWRRRIVSVPQFHENHVLTETLAFNLLMGRHWPPTAQDFADAEEICVELGLGDLLERMPSGLQQMVGEGGWQLSHGERSRLYIARALLQQADVIILDESFAALDPVNLERTLECVFRRSPALLVIAHP